MAGALPLLASAGGRVVSMAISRDPDRLVFFTDAVVAIAITLLVLPLVDVVPMAAQNGLIVKSKHCVAVCYAPCVADRTRGEGLSRPFATPSFRSFEACQALGMTADSD